MRDSAEVDGALPEEPERLRQRLVRLAGPLVADHGAELVDVEISGTGSCVVRLLVHRNTGVTVDLCAAISREFSDLLDVEDPVPGRYRLEVTSPGLDRPLRTDGDFHRARNRRLKVVTTGGHTWCGRLIGFTHDQIELRDDGAYGPRTVSRCDIARATIEVELSKTEWDER